MDYRASVGRKIYGINMKILTAILLLLFKASFTTTVSASGTSEYIADGAYLKYRMELVQEALNNPLIAQRIQNAQSMEEVNDILKIELEDKLKKYREENGLDENGASKE